MQNERENIQIIPIQCYEDNYTYLLLGGKQNEGILIDPSDIQKIEAFFKNQSHLKITHILYTHKHWDHAGNSQQLKNFFQGLPQNKDHKIQLIAHDQDAQHIKGIDKILNEKKNEFVINESFKITSYHVPCHTKGHALYYIEPLFKNAQLSQQDQQLISSNQSFQSQKALFTGDTLFIGGAGRFFEGNSQEMYQNFELISTLPDDTDVYCGHEYTVANYKWAVQVEKNNQNLINNYNKAKKLRQQGKFTIPSTILNEKQTNIFMRCNEKSLQELFNNNNPVEIMTQLREMKNQGQTEIQQKL
ncbi:hypothetical protein PPERSA_12428 [Pseudocohnilembus persalinus]|uniref:hydroxyacylglutathione hydrolase n=1 Tax=Pseudocohnilembus persalinus TaxID=266149 RepID=A0A0V0QP92_PSEPJ|nr:hypothetical protein PPERSA_12428 [Pseudocohnilembus persalinus]|eukprot:KRX03981.1 hypothetical protein PPERSA_12428 [Pseudocohnilembus persalinus]